MVVTAIASCEVRKVVPCSCCYLGLWSCLISRRPSRPTRVVAIFEPVWLGSASIYVGGLLSRTLTRMNFEKKSLLEFIIIGCSIKAMG